VTTPDVVIVFDDSLLAVAGATTGVKPGGVVLVNTTQSADALGLTGDFRVVATDVTGAAEVAGVIVGGQPIVSAAILGAIAKATGLATLESVEAAIAGTFAPGPAAKNAEAARIAYECTPGEQV
jgi:2-oxoacid:acceptor oxidoreductase gamma subunit (pyruvate/2-ketoisovalerate family)